MPEISSIVLKLIKGVIRGQPRNYLSPQHKTESRGLSHFKKGAGMAPLKIYYENTDQKFIPPAPHHSRHKSDHRPNQRPFCRFPSSAMSGGRCRWWQRSRQRYLGGLFFWGGRVWSCVLLSIECEPLNGGDYAIRHFLI